MRRSSVARLALAAGALVVLIGAAGAQTTGRVSPTASGAQREIPLDIGRCYRLVFPIAGAPVYRVLDVESGGWVKAEVVAGPATVEREPLWINAAQIITIRGARCAP